MLYLILIKLSCDKSAEQFFSAVEHLRGLDLSKRTKEVNIFVGTWNMGMIFLNHLNIIIRPHILINIQLEPYLS